MMDHKMDPGWIDKQYKTLWMMDEDGEWSARTEEEEKEKEEERTRIPQ